MNKVDRIGWLARQSMCNAQHRERLLSGKTSYDSHQAQKLASEYEHHIIINAQELEQLLVEVGK